RIDAPVGVRQAWMLELQRLAADFSKHPGFASGHRLVEFVAVAAFVALRAVDQEGSRSTGIEGKLLDRADARFTKDRAPPPGRSPVAGNQEERVLRERDQLLAANPAGLEIEELNLFEGRRLEALERLSPGFPVVR